MNLFRLFGALAAIPVLLLPASALAEDCDNRTTADTHSAINLRIDNDLLGGHGQDQGYTNGLLLTAVSPNLIDRRNDPCMPEFAQWLDQHLSRLHPDGFDQVNIVGSFAHGLFTPTNPVPAELIRDDRPYAAGFIFGIGYNARKGDSLRTSHLRLGWIGPSTRGRQIQNWVHKLTGSDPFNGWNNQLRDEPIFQIQHERLRRLELPSPGFGGLQQDVIGFVGGAIGNLRTDVNIGGEWRLGWKLPDDFGSSPLNVAGENTAPPIRDSARRNLAGHLFVTASGSWTLHDISLDGNTFKDSHRVKRKPLGAELGFGISTTWRSWKFTMARHFRTREFEGQKDRPFYGSFTISRQF